MLKHDAWPPSFCVNLWAECSLLVPVIMMWRWSRVVGEGLSQATKSYKCLPHWQNKPSHYINKLWAYWLEVFNLLHLTDSGERALRTETDKGKREAVQSIEIKGWSMRCICIKSCDIDPSPDDLMQIVLSDKTPFYCLISKISTDKKKTSWALLTTARLIHTDCYSGLWWLTAHNILPAVWHMWCYQNRMKSLQSCLQLCEAVVLWTSADMLTMTMLAH